MTETIVVVSADDDQLSTLITVLDGHHYGVVASRSAQGLSALVREHGSVVIILDLDTVPADNRLLRVIKQEHPSVHIILISAGLFHPELQEAMVSAVDVCLSKPPKHEELLFWLKSVFQDAQEPRAGPDLKAEASAAKVHLDSYRNIRGDEEMPQ